MKGPMRFGADIFVHYVINIVWSGDLGERGSGGEEDAGKLQMARPSELCLYCWVPATAEILLLLVS